MVPTAAAALPLDSPARLPAVKTPITLSQRRRRTVAEVRPPRRRPPVPRHHRYGDGDASAPHTYVHRPTRRFRSAAACIAAASARPPAILSVSAISIPIPMYRPPAVHLRSLCHSPLATHHILTPPSRPRALSAACMALAHITRMAHGTWYTSRYMYMMYARTARASAPGGAREKEQNVDHGRCACVRARPRVHIHTYTLRYASRNHASKSESPGLGHT